jgi:predicted RNA-binding Zn ribbon-like protein
MPSSTTGATTTRAGRSSNGVPPRPPRQVDHRAAVGTHQLRALLANHDRSPIPAADLAALNEDRAGLRVGFVPSGDWRARPARGGADGALGRLLGTVAQAMADGTWIRLKACLNDDCRWAFYDHSNARASKWCDMRICGNRAKQKAWRTRSR